MRPLFDRQVEQVFVGLRGLVRADLSSEFVATDDVGRLEADEVWSGERAQVRSRARAIVAAVAR